MAGEMKPSKAWLPNPLCCGGTDHAIGVRHTHSTTATSTAHVTLNDILAGAGGTSTQPGASFAANLPRLGVISPVAPKGWRMAIHVLPH